MKRILFAVLASWSLTGALPQAGNLDGLRQDLEKIVNGFAGDIGVAAKNIELDELVMVRGRELYPMASTYKVAIMAEVFKQAEEGRFSLEDRVELTADLRRPGSGLLTYFDAGLRPTMRDLILMMMAVSDNMATDILLNRVGPANVTATMRKAGLPAIRIDRTTREIIGDYNKLLDPRLATASPAEVARMRAALTPAQVRAANETFTAIELDVTTPVDMTELLAKIYKGEMVSKAAGQQMMDILARNQIHTRLHRNLPDGARVYSKYGSIGGSLNDVGIMFVGDQHVAISVYLKNSRTERYLAEDAIGRIARAVYDYYRYTRRPSPVQSSGARTTARTARSIGPPGCGIGVLEGLLAPS